MELFSEEYRSFIENHIYDHFTKLRNTEEYTQERLRYSSAVKELYSKVSQDQKEEIEKIFNLQSTLHTQEILFCYNLGVTDGIKLENCIHE